MPGTDHPTQHGQPDRCDAAPLRASPMQVREGLRDWIRSRTIV